MDSGEGDRKVRPTHESNARSSVTDLPHDSYIEAVLSALSAGGLAPDQYEIETPDGERLDAVLNWNPSDLYPNPSEWPHGVLVCWSQFEGWEYAANRADGSNDHPKPLLTEFLAAPEAIVEAVRMLLRHPDGLPLPGTEWTGKPNLQKALDAWNAEIAE